MNKIQSKEPTNAKKIKKKFTLLPTEEIPPQTNKFPPRNLPRKPPDFLSNYQEFFSKPDNLEACLKNQINRGWGPANNFECKQGVSVRGWVINSGIETNQPQIDLTKSNTPEKIPEMFVFNTLEKYCNEKGYNLKFTCKNVTGDSWCAAITAGPHFESEVGNSEKGAVNNAAAKILKGIFNESSLPVPLVSKPMDLPPAPSLLPVPISLPPVVSVQVPVTNTTRNPVSELPPVMVFPPPKSPSPEVVKKRFSECKPPTVKRKSKDSEEERGKERRKSEDRKDSRSRDRRRSRENRYSDEKNKDRERGDRQSAERKKVRDKQGDPDDFLRRMNSVVINQFDCDF